MDILCSPWRYDYISKGQAAPTSGCVFCDILANGRTDEENFTLHRGTYNFVILNIYPYTSGHLMILPYAHVPGLAEAGEKTAAEMMSLASRSQTVIQAVYSPDGMNLGINLGRAAGAGVAGHVHMHALPRWVGDANFMTAIGETRTIPESLSETYAKLRPKFDQ